MAKRLHLNKVLLFILFLGFMTSFSTHVKAQGISVSPLIINFEGTAGQTISEEIRLTNSSKTPYEFIGSIQDWQRDSLGNITYSPMGTLPHSNARRLRISETNFTVAPGAEKSITVFTDIPQRDDRKTSNSMLFFTQTNVQDAPNNQTGIGIKIAYAFGIQIFETPLNAKKGDLAFVDFTYKDSIAVNDKVQKQLAVHYENSGEINKSGVVRFELTNKESGEEFKLDPIPFGIMPLSSQWAMTTLPENFKAGNYLAVAILDGGEGFNLKVAEKNIHVY